jgi:hypothetical protein
VYLGLVFTTTDTVNSTLDYMLLLESETILAQPVVEALLELVQAMDSAMEAEEVCRCGRPRIVVGEEQLCFFVENGFRIKDIASIFLCSECTVERRLAEIS